MNITQIQPQSLTTLATEQPAAGLRQPVAQPLVADVPASQPATLSRDLLQNSKIKQGIVPTLKGAGAGFLMGGVTAGAATAIVLFAGKAPGGALAKIAVGALYGGALGALPGAYTANTTDDMGKALKTGAGAGIFAGVAHGFRTGHPPDMLFGIGAGALFAGAGAIGGALVAERR